MIVLTSSFHALILALGTLGWPGGGSLSVVDFMESGPWVNGLLFASARPGPDGDLHEPEEVESDPTPDVLESLDDLEDKDDDEVSASPVQPVLTFSLRSTDARSSAWSEPARACPLFLTVHRFRC